MNKDELTVKQIETVKQLRKDLKMNRREFSEFTEIPIRTLEEWEAGRRTMPAYMLRMLDYYIRINQYLDKKGLKEQIEKEAFGNEQ